MFSGNVAEHRCQKNSGDKNQNNLKKVEAPFKEEQPMDFMPNIVRLFDHAGTFVSPKSLDQRVSNRLLLLNLRWSLAGPAKKDGC